MDEFLDHSFPFLCRLLPREVLLDSAVPDLVKLGCLEVCYSPLQGSHNRLDICRIHFIRVHFGHLVPRDALLNSVDQSTARRDEGNRPVLHGLQLDQSTRFETGGNHDEIRSGKHHVRQWGGEFDNSFDVILLDGLEQLFVFRFSSAQNNKLAFQVGDIGKGLEEYV